MRGAVRVMRARTHAECAMASDGSLRVLVTGASGYLGQFLLDEILRNGGTAGGRRILAAGTYSSRAESIPAGVLAGVCLCVCACVCMRVYACAVAATHGAPAQTSSLNASVHVGACMCSAS